MRPLPASSRPVLSLVGAVVFAALMLSGAAHAQGVELRSAATVWSGNASTCSQPATVRFDAVRDATPEWKTIKSEGVKKGSARYSLLITEMNDRIRAACQKIAEDEAKDCVVNSGDIRNENGLRVVDVTDAVVRRLESSQPLN